MAIEGILRVIGPSLGAASSGPLAPHVLSVLRSALDLPADAGAELVEAAVHAATGPQLVAIRAANDAFAKIMGQIGVDVAATRGRASDRGAGGGETKNTATRVLALVVGLGFFSIVGVFAFHVIPAENQQVMNLMTGAAIAGWGTVLNFFFGSSSSAAAKDRLLLAATPPPKAA